MRINVRSICPVLLTGVIVTCGCEPVQSGDLSHRDLGTPERVLVPTAMTLADAAVSTGSAQWQKLREPNFDQPGDSGAPSPAPGATTDAGESAEVVLLRELIADYNAVVAEKAFTDLPGFLVEAQVEPTEKLVELVPMLASKGAELNGALPAPNEKLGKLLDAISLTKLFHLDVGAIKLDSPTAGTGQVTSGGVVKFVIEGEDWYLEHPMVTAVVPALSELEQGGGVLDKTMADVQSGALSGDALDAGVGTVIDLLTKLVPDSPGASGDADDTVGT